MVNHPLLSKADRLCQLMIVQTLLDQVNSQAMAGLRSTAMSPVVATESKHNRYVLCTHNSDRITILPQTIISKLI